MAAETSAVNGLAREEVFGRRLALVSISVGVLLAVLKILVGINARSTAVLSDGCEAAGDVLSSTIVYAGLWLASKPPDAEHPYGHGRYETLSGLGVGAILLLAGAGILVHSIAFAEVPPHLPLYAVAPLLASVVLKVGLATWKFRIGKRIASTSLQADAWHDLSDLVSTGIALIAVTLTLANPARFGLADRVGGVLIGIIIILLSARVVRQTVEHLVDTMPEEKRMNEIRAAAQSVPGTLGIEKCLARRSGMKYHVDLHLEVDPDMSVRRSHDIATEVRAAIKRDLPWVADVLVHVEPSPLLPKRAAAVFRSARGHGK